MNGQAMDLRLVLPILYLLIGAPIVLANAFILAPMQAADEESHFLHVVEISRGGIVGMKLPPGGSGNYVDTSAHAERDAFIQPKFHKNEHEFFDLAEKYKNVPWNWPEKDLGENSNTVIYPPFFYLPAVAGVKLSQWLDTSVLDGLTMARLANGLAWLALSALALRVADSGRFILFAVLSLPMTLSLYGTCSQDGGMIAVAAASVTALSRRNPLHARAKLLSSLGIGAVIAGRFPYFPLAIVTLLPALRAMRRQDRWHEVPRNLVWPLLALLVPVAWYLIGFRHLGAMERTDANISPAGQVHHLVEQPLFMADVFAETLRLYFHNYLHEFIGVLGSLDVPLPELSYDVYEVALVLALVYTVLFERAVISAGSRLLVAAAVLASCAGVALSLYLVWSSVGQSSIDGIQGRYFLVPFVALAPVFGMRSWSAETPVYAERLAAASLALLAADGLWVVPRALMARYWG